MNEIRSDFNSERNQQIYTDYLTADPASGKTPSYGDLAKKYSVSPQRIQAIIKDIETKGLADPLETSEPKSTREEYKSKAEIYRERGNLALAKSMFEKVLAWDLANENIAGAIDIYAHISGVYMLMAKMQSNTDKKEDCYKNAENQIQSALLLENKYPEILDEGRKANLNIHLAGIINDKLRNIPSENKKIELEKALGLVESALSVIKGSQASKAWPKRLKGELLFWIGRREESIETLLSAEKDLFLGYKEEVSKDIKNEFKIAIWLTGIYITLAGIALKMERPVLAKLYAMAVISAEDKTGTLNERKKEARRILEQL